MILWKKFSSFVDSVFGVLPGLALVTRSRDQQKTGATRFGELLRVKPMTL
jgi:hypothetical protein